MELEKIGPKMVGGEIPPLREFFTEPLPEKPKCEGVVFERLRRRVFLSGHELDEGIEFAVGVNAH